MSLEAQLSSLSLVAALWIPFVCHVHSYQYLCFSRISSTAANRYGKFTSLLKRNVSITSISQPIKLVNVAFQSLPYIHAEWAILVDDVRDASVDYYIFIEIPWQALNIPMVGLYNVQMWKWIVMIFLCDIFSITQEPTRRNGGMLVAGAGSRCR